ncbi:hypothetical protein DEU56DRAFT_832831 [Suillus clintonianus]|uniref:uncharacterized protein n=1 Tax=Suillus clintonianus TaxID=1904413 RepID=UPI001B860ACA|nr:uncharacterized protein DEU56DRAFT_832831 [Suillus clintonianus]KAG2122115.1 hypothetical protein DEU56DRAFT_832831 [Suillus clintonianus]
MIFGDLSACVFVDGEELPEYDVILSTTPTENRITCWIASEEGKKFGVRWMNTTQQSWGIRATVSVDGVPCATHMVPPGGVGTNNFTCLVNDSVTRDFMFSNIELTDDDSMLGDQNSNDIGQIVLVVNTGKYTKKAINHGKLRNHTLRVREGRVHERSKKACAHRVIFGEEVPRQVQHKFSSSLEPDNRPATVFVFKYTRLDILQAMGIAPLTSKNPVKEEANDHGDEVEIIDGPYQPSSLTSEEVKPRIQHLEMELQRLRAQLASSEDRKPSRVKLECKVSRRQHTAMEILDLTED